MFSLKSSSFLTFATIFTFSIIGNSFAAENEIVKGSLCWALTECKKENQKPMYSIKFFDASLREIHSINIESVSPDAFFINKVDSVSPKNFFLNSEESAKYTAMLDHSTNIIKVTRHNKEPKIFANSYNTGFYFDQESAIKNGIFTGYKTPHIQFYNDSFSGLKYTSSFSLFLKEYVQDLIWISKIYNYDKSISFVAMHNPSQTKLTIVFSKEMLHKINHACKNTLLEKNRCISTNKMVWNKIKNLPWTMICLIGGYTCIVSGLTLAITAALMPSK